MAEMLKTYAEDLKAAREEKNLSLKTISQQTRLNTTILEQLENGDYTFQPQTYIRAFLKQYINSIGLDVEETLFDYDLARSGKYKSQRQPEAHISSQATEKEPAKDQEENKSRVNDVNKEATAPKEKKEINPVIQGPPRGPFLKTSGTTNEQVEKKIENKFTLQKPEKVNPDYKPQNIKKNKLSFSFLSSPVVRNIVLILFICLVLLGIYSLINILFFENSKDNPQVVRQNFDEVVKEQEKKILGKRSPEEIRDSIRKAEEELAASKDSITLKVTGLNSGVLLLITDSVNYNKPDRIEFQKNDKGTFKARNLFFISSANTDAFKATINDKPIKFGKTSVSKVKVNKNGIVK